MDIDGTDAFNRLLERIEELVSENARTDVALSSERHRVSVLEHENRNLTRQASDIARLERFVESTPERQADWMAYITPKPKDANGDDLPF